MKAKRYHYEATWGPGFDYVEPEDAEWLESEVERLKAVILDQCRKYKELNQSHQTPSVSTE